MAAIWACWVGAAGCAAHEHIHRITKFREGHSHYWQQEWEQVRVMWRVVVVWDKLHRVRQGKWLWWCERGNYEHAEELISELFPLKWYREAQVNLFAWRLKYILSLEYFQHIKADILAYVGQKRKEDGELQSSKMCKFWEQYRTPELNSYLQSGTQNTFCYFVLKCYTSRGHPNLIKSLVKPTAAQYAWVQGQLKAGDMFYICFSSYGWAAHGETQFGQLLKKQICVLVQLCSQCGWEHNVCC